MITSWPKTIKPNQVSQALIDSVDFLPTLLDAAGASDLVAKDLDGLSFLPILQNKQKQCREHVLIHQDPRPGWDKDRFGRIRCVIGEQFKLYEDGRMFNLQEDFFEEHPIWPTGEGDNPNSRQWLESVLESYTPYPVFSPDSVPRPDPNRHLQRHAFQAQGNGDYFVIEAEQIPVGRDETWSIESYAPGFFGLGYLRALQHGEKTEENVAKIRMIVEAAGNYRVAARLRHDTSIPSGQN